MTNLQPQFYKDMSGGMVTNVNKNLTPPNTVALGLNVDFDEEIGSAVTRLGTGIVGSQYVSGQRVYGLHQFTDPANSANNTLFAVVGQDIRSATFTSDHTTETFTSVAHGLVNGDRIVPSTTGTLPAGLLVTNYYVINRTADTFQLSLTQNGTAQLITSNGTGTHTWTLDVSRLYINGATSGNVFAPRTKVRMTSFLGATLFLDGNRSPASYNPSGGWILTGGAFDLANIPNTYCDISIEWLDRVYLAGAFTAPDRLYYSSTPSAGAVSWTSGNGYVDIEPEDGGGGITGLGKVPGFLLIFKERALKRWSFDSAFPETLIQIGTPSHESIINAGGLCAFFSASSKEARGFYVTNGDRPVAISHDRLRNIKKWVDAIPQSAEANICGWGDAHSFWWSIGDVTVDGRTYQNVVVRWNRVLDQWSVRSYPTEFTVFSSYVTSGTNAVVAGDNDGQVIELDKANTYTDYNAQPINFEIVFQEEDFNFNQKKIISEAVVVNSTGMEGARVTIDHSGKKTAAGTVKGRVTELKLSSPVTDNVIQVGVAGVVNGQRGTLKEVELPNVEVLRNY